MKAKTFIDILFEMKKHGVSIYGYGDNGKRAQKELESAGIEIKRISDARWKDFSDDKKMVSPEDFILNKDSGVCVVTPYGGGKRFSR